MTPTRFENWLADAIEAQCAEAGPGDPIRGVETNHEAGVLTRDRGLVIRFNDGSEIQLTLVQSRRGPDDEDDDE
jgi:hypothetical protein